MTQVICTTENFRVSTVNGDIWVELNGGRDALDQIRWMEHRIYHVSDNFSDDSKELAVEMAGEIKALKHRVKYLSDQCDSLEAKNKKEGV